jgi:hypothetical protein
MQTHAFWQAQAECTDNAATHAEAVYGAEKAEKKGCNKTLR